MFAVGHCVVQWDKGEPVVAIVRYGQRNVGEQTNRIGFAFRRKRMGRFWLNRDQRPVKSNGSRIDSIGNAVNGPNFVTRERGLPQRRHSR